MKRAPFLEPRVGVLLSSSPGSDCAPDGSQIGLGLWEGGRGGRSGGRGGGRGRRERQEEGAGRQIRERVGRYVGWRCWHWIR